MKKYLFVFSAFVLLFGGCSTENDPASFPVKEVLKSIYDGVSDTSSIDCLFRVLSASEWSYDDSFSIHHEYANYCWAYISDGVNLINPTSITCNGNIMHSMVNNEAPGQFEYVDMSGYMLNVNWVMNGYLEANYSANDVNLPEIAVSNCNQGDTLHLSNGINLTYTGYLGEDSIAFMFSYDYLDNNGNTLSYLYQKNMPDNGSIVISAAELAGLPVPYINENVDYYVNQIGIARKKFTTETFNNKKICKLYETHWSNLIHIVE